MLIQNNFLFLLVKNNEIVGILQESTNHILKMMEKCNVCIIPVYKDDLNLDEVKHYSSVFKCWKIYQERFFIKNNIFCIMQKLINI